MVMIVLMVVMVMGVAMAMAMVVIVIAMINMTAKGLQWAVSVRDGKDGSEGYHLDKLAFLLV